MLYVHTRLFKTEKIYPNIELEVGLPESLGLDESLIIFNQGFIELTIDKWLSLIIRDLCKTGKHA